MEFPACGSFSPTAAELCRRKRRARKNPGKYGTQTEVRNRGKAQGRRGTRPPGTDEDFDDLLGQEGVKRAAVISASGFHNLLLIGPPGSGKSMTARRIPSILPPMTREEQLEVTRLYSIAGLLPSGQPLIRNRPFRAPHHSITAQALVGGGRFPSPGEITLAHRGVLFLDELPEMSRRCWSCCGSRWRSIRF